MTVWNFVIWLHLLGMAFFVGGQLMLAAVIVPVVRSDRDKLLAAVRRFGVGTGVALLVLVGTGVALASHEHRWGSTTLQVKIGLIALVVALIAAHARWPAVRDAEGRTVAKARMWRHLLESAIFVVSLAIVWLGVVLAGG
jgi:putative copper export protein